MAGEDPEVLCGVCLTDLYELPPSEAIVGELDSCNHRFCFPCISRWSEVENSCPFCKLRFGQLRRKQLASREELVGAEPNAPLPGRYLDVQQVPERNQRVVFEDPGFQAWIEQVACLVCGGGEDEDQLLLCDECDRACHTYCAGVEGIPEGDWFCPECAERRAAAAAGRRRRHRAELPRQNQAPRGRAGGSRARAAQVIDLLSSEDEEEEDARPARRRRLAQQPRQRLARSAAEGGMDDFIVGESEEEDGEAEWGASRSRGGAQAASQRNSRRAGGARSGGVRPTTQAAPARRPRQLASDSDSDFQSPDDQAAAGRGVTAAGGGRRQLGVNSRGVALRGSDAASEEEGEYLFGEEESEPDAELSDSQELGGGSGDREEEGDTDEDIPLRMRLGARMGGTARRRSGAAGSARTAGAARQQAHSSRPSAAAREGAARRDGAAEGPTVGYRAVAALRDNWAAIRNGTASFRATGAGATAQPAAAAAGPAPRRRQRLVRVGELDDSIRADPARQAAVALSQAQRGAGAGASPGMVDLTSPSPLGGGSRGPGSKMSAEEEQRAWRALDEAMREPRAGGGQHAQRGGRRVLESEEEEEDPLNQNLASRLRQQLAACRDKGSRLLPRQPPGAAAGSPTPGPPPARAAGEVGLCVPSSTSPTPRRHARSLADMRFAANVARGTPVGGGRITPRNPSAPFVIPRRVASHLEEREARGGAPQGPFPLPHQQQQQQQWGRRGGEENRPWQPPPARIERAPPRASAHPPSKPGTAAAALAAAAVAAAVEADAANPFKRFSLQPSNHGAAEGPARGAAAQQAWQAAPQRSNHEPHLGDGGTSAKRSLQQQHQQQQQQPVEQSASVGGTEAAAAPACWEAQPPAFPPSALASTAPLPAPTTALPAQRAMPPPSAPAAAPSPTTRFPSSEWPGFSQVPESCGGGEGDSQATPSVERLQPAVIPSSTPFMRGHGGSWWDSPSGVSLGAGGSSSRASPRPQHPGSHSDRHASQGAAPLALRADGGASRHGDQHARQGHSGDSMPVERGQQHRRAATDATHTSSGGSGSGMRRHVNSGNPKQEAFEQVRVHLKGPLRDGQISREQYKQLARDLTHQLAGRGRLKDAEVAAAVHEALAKLA